MNCEHALEAMPGTCLAVTVCRAVPDVPTRDYRPPAYLEGFARCGRLKAQGKCPKDKKS